MFPYLKHIQLFLRLIRVLKAPFRYLLYDPAYDGKMVRV